MNISLLPDEVLTNAKLSSNIETVSSFSMQVIMKKAWSPFLFANKRRLASEFVETQLLVYDVDNDPEDEFLSVEEAARRLLACRHVIAASKSHMRVKKSNPAVPRYRIILYLAEKISSAEDYAATWKLTAKNLGIDRAIDQQAKDVARFYYPCTEILHEQSEGMLVNVERAVAAAPAETRLLTSTRKTGNTKGKLSRKTLQFLSGEFGEENWHNNFIAAAMDMKEQGYSLEEAAERLVRASPELELDEEHDWPMLEDVFNKRGGALSFRLNWPGMMNIRSRDGDIVGQRINPKSLENFAYLFKEVLQVTFKHNIRRAMDYVVFADKPPRYLTDGDMATFRTEARRYDLAPGYVDDFVKASAIKNLYDPLMEAVEALSWDSIPRIQALFETITLPADVSAVAREQYALWLRRFLIGMIKRVYEPGSENNVLVFQGAQAAGKSRWLKKLSTLWPEGFGEGQISPDNKDHEFRLVDNFLWHVAEFDSTTTRREVGALKDYFTKDIVNARRPYAEFSQVGAAVCSFCASVNSFDFLQDVSGNRRYLVIPVVSMDHGHCLDMFQVMAEAKAAYRAGERQWFTKEEIEDINKLNDYFMSKEDYIVDLEAQAEPGEDWMTTAAILSRLGYPSIPIFKNTRSQIRTVLQKKGIEYGFRNNAGKFKINSAKLTAKKPLGKKMQ